MYGFGELLFCVIVIDESCIRFGEGDMYGEESGKEYKCKGVGGGREKKGVGERG